MIIFDTLHSTFLRMIIVSELYIYNQNGDFEFASLTLIVLRNHSLTCYFDHCYNIICICKICLPSLLLYDIFRVFKNDCMCVLLFFSTRAGQISEEEAREALLEYVSQHCCYMTSFVYLRMIVCVCCCSSPPGLVRSVRRRPERLS